MYFKQQTKNGYIQLAHQNQYKYFGTFTFRGDITSPITADRSIRKFYDRLCAEVFGEKSRRRLPFMAVREKHASGVWHWHYLISPPNRGWYFERFKEAVRQSWKATGGHHGDPDVYKSEDDEWFQNLTTQEHKENAYAYICKGITDGLTVNLDTLHGIEVLFTATPSKTDDGVQAHMRKKRKPLASKLAKAKPVQSPSMRAKRNGHTNTRKGFASVGN